MIYDIVIYLYDGVVFSPETSYQHNRLNCQWPEDLRITVQYGIIISVLKRDVFKICKSVHHHTIQINYQRDATIFQFIILTIIYSSTCFGRPARPRTQHDYHHDTKVKPEATTAVIELLMMGGVIPETCWAVNNRQDNKLENCCISLVIYLNCMMMHGLTNLKHITF